MKRIWCNGQWLDPQDFPASPMDRGSIHGLGLFETMLAIDGALLFADRHLARLRCGHEKLGWPVDFPAIREIAAELLLQNGLGTGRARVRLTVTGGSGPIHDLTPGADRLVWMSAFPALVPPESISACISPWPRNEHSPLAGLKCASYSENLIALDHARRMGFDETIFLNTAGHLCEAATANLFLVRNGTLLTPPLDSGCLPGITRELVIEHAAETGIPCEVRAIGADQMEAAEEIFLTSSTIGVLPVCRLGQRAIPPGPFTRRLRERLSENWSAGLQSAREAKGP
jgi:branched-subunit amino acid aminotransferase/4-amino-4-deoxychorismate lyase